MKKIIMMILVCFLLFGCKQANNEDKQHDIYASIKQKLINQSHFVETYPFQATLVYNEVNNEYRYDIIISDASEDMYSLIVMAYAGEEENQMCPTLGIFDEDFFHLIPDYIDKVNGYYKGVQLSGKVKSKANIKLYIKYYTDESKKNSIEKYIEVKDEIR